MTSSRKPSGGDFGMSDMKSLGRRIRQLRGFDVTQDEFAKTLRISQSQLSKYERGIVAPPADVLIRIKEQFRVSIDWLLTGDPVGGERHPDARFSP
jgi:transcriptional regulator with XRE-family HTH domain